MSRIQAQLTAAAGSGPHTATLDEARQFYQSRVALLGKVGAVFIALFWLFSSLFFVISGQHTLRDCFTSAGSIASFVNGGLALSIWLACRAGDRPLGLLQVLDAGFLVSYCCVMGGWVWISRGDGEAVISSHLPINYAIIVRAVIVPGAASRTALISALAWLPYGGVVLAVVATTEDETAVLPDPALFVIRGLIGVALAAVVSQVIYGLRRQVRKATQLGQYRLEEKIGEGGMGEVYRARHALLRRPTAIKLLRKDSVSDHAIARFEREVQLTSLLTHPNTIAIFDFGRTPDGTFYYAMELLDGVDLDRLVKTHGPQEPRRVIHVLQQVCGSLGEAHASDLIHRDVKPANVILCERGNRLDVAKLVDFGLVKNLDTSGGDVSLSSVGMITGTPLYMSPEAIRDPASVDGRSDLYAVGAIGYYLLTGKQLFDSKNVMEVCSLQLSAAPARPSERLGEELPEDLERVILRCLAKSRDERPASAYELLDELSACRDAGRWSDADARDWWRSRAPEDAEPSSSASAAQAAGGRALTTSDGVAPPAGSGLASLATIDVDLEHR